MLVGAGAMPRRSAAGREMMRRALGFRRCIDRAEKNSQQFDERANIFTAVAGSREPVRAGFS